MKGKGEILDDDDIALISNFLIFSSFFPSYIFPQMILNSLDRQDDVGNENVTFFHLMQEIKKVSKNRVD